jgi:serine O-acetyltransferase
MSQKNQLNHICKKIDKYKKMNSFGWVGFEFPRKKELDNFYTLFHSIVFSFNSEQENIRMLQNVQNFVVFLEENIGNVLNIFCNPEKEEVSKNYVNFVVSEILDCLPQIHVQINLDVLAAYNGDPAANSVEEIALAYPFVKAILMHRLANILYQKKIPYLPRIFSEYAHSDTGIDIHPGASIGDSFFIDHGTGVVIGETCVIGNNVKIYQGVTLGALSIPKRKNGCVSVDKRHPTIEDNVVIYASATILGDVTIGDGSVIGGNVWVKKSIPENTVLKN